MGNRSSNIVIIVLLLALVLLGSVVVFGFANKQSPQPPDPTNPPATAAPTASPTATPTATATAAPSATPSHDATLGIESPGCIDTVRWQEQTQVGTTPDMDPVKGQDQTVPCDTMYRVMNYWQVQSTDSALQGDFKLQIGKDQHVVLKGGGGSMWPFIYSGQALGEFQKNRMKEITLEQLVSLGLATVTGGSKSPTSSPGTGSSSSNNPPAPQDGCTTTNKQSTPDELVAVGTFTPLPILHRIDAFGYSGWSLSEFYTLVADKTALGSHRVPTIGYVGQPREDLKGLVGIWFGEGSFWDYGDNAQCNKDYAFKWATFYALSGAIEPGRLENGNSGIVVTMDDCKLYNNRPDLGWNHSNIQALLNDHLAAMATFPCSSLKDASDGFTYTVTPGAHDLRSSDSNFPAGTTTEQCGETRVSDNHPSVLNGSVWRITTSSNEVAVVNFWSNWTNPNYPFVKFILAPNSDVRLKGGGDATFFPANCQDAINQAMKNLASNQRVIDFAAIPASYKQ